MKSSLILGVSMLVAGLVLGEAAPASAAGVAVANWGTDTGGCGASSAPCRSITQAIANAPVGGTIVVGPGNYGDLDADGVLGEPGEEVPGLGVYGPTLILVDKAVTITSSAGAFATVISPGPDATLTEAFSLMTSGVVLGAVGKGFTIEAPRNVVVAVGATVPGAVTGTVIAGNLMPLNEYATGISTASDTQLIGNRITGPGSSVHLGYGVYATSPLTLVSGNVVSGCFQGLGVLGGVTSYVGNVVHGNGYGARISAGTLNVTKSSFQGNHLNALAISTGTVTITASNLTGNGDTAGLNCAIHNLAGTLTLTGNWWGAPTGPGADPSDLVCGTMAADTAPAAAALKVKVKGLR